MAEQKSKSKFRESSGRNKPSKVSQSIPQTADSATFMLPPEEELDCTQPGPDLVRPEAQEHMAGAARLVLVSV